MIAIYKKNDAETLSILIPALNCGLTIQEICKKVVPTGVKYKLFNISDLPDLDYLSAWEYDFTDSYDGVGA